MRFLLRLLISAGVIFGVAYLSDGALLQLTGDPRQQLVTALIAAVVLTVVNIVVKPVVHLFSLPVTILTLGLFSLVINAFMLYIVDWVVPGFSLVGFWRTVIAALVMGIATGILIKLFEGDRE